MTERHTEKSPDFRQTVARLLWGSFPKEQSKPFFRVSVEPGSKTIRRKTDQLISAHLNGFTSTKASVFVRYTSSAKWEEALMEPLKGGAGFGYPLVGVQEDEGEEQAQGNRQRHDDRRARAHQKKQEHH